MVIQVLTFLFLFSTNLINYVFFILLFIFIIIAIICSICLKIFEDYNSFSGYKTDFLLAAFDCLLGSSLQSLFIISMFLFIVFSNENESKAYAEINLLFDKEKENSEHNIYFKNLIKYKFRKLFNKNGKGNPLILMQRVSLDFFLTWKNFGNIL